mgnify:CR=1 FL=1
MYKFTDDDKTGYTTAVSHARNYTPKEETPTLNKDNKRKIKDQYGLEYI